MKHTPMDAAAIIMNGREFVATAFGNKRQAGIAEIISDTTASPDLLALAFVERVAATKVMAAKDDDLLKGWIAMICEARAVIAKATGAGS